MPDNLIPDHIGSLTALAVSGLAAVLIVHKKFGLWLKNSFSGIWTLAKMLMTLQQGHERNEKLLADHEVRIRNLDWIKSDNEAIHTQVADHESRLRIAEHRQNEDEAIREQFKLKQDSMEKSISSLSQESKLQSMQLNQLLINDGVTNEQLRGFNQRMDLIIDQQQILMQSMLEKNK